MSFTETWQAIVQDFVFCVEREKVPPLSGYFPEYVKTGCAVVPDDYRLVPLTPDSLRLLITSSDCLTDCMFELQSKYQQFVPDDWGGHLEKGRRDLGVIGFNVQHACSVRDEIVLDIREINKTSGYSEWAEPKLDALHWERLLIHAVIAFGRSCQAKQVRLQPAHRYPLGVEAAADSAKSAECQEELKRRYDSSAQASKFHFDEALDCFVLDLA